MQKILSRRQFLKSSVNLMGAISLGRLINPSQFPSYAKEANPLPSAAAAVGTDVHTPAEILKTALDAVGGISRFVKPGQSVAIKPNATWAFAPHTASSTDPEVLRALIQLVQEAGASRIIVTDHCAIEPGTAQCLQANGLGAIVDETGVEGHFPDRYLASKDTFMTIDLPDGHAFKKIGVVKAAVQSDVRINMGVAKCHSVTRMTLALKHMMGFLQTPGGLHANIHKGIADINTMSAIRADLHILEALRIRMAYGDYVTCGGPETDETHPFMIKRLNQMIVGSDPVLVDAYACSTFYAVKPVEFAHLKNAADWGIGNLDIESARINGKFQIVKVGETSVLQPEPQPTVPPVELGQTDKSENENTGLVPLPEVPQAGKFEIDSSSPQQIRNNAINSNEFLKNTLIPASMILVGAGLVAARKRFSTEKPDDDTQQDGQKE